MPAVVQSLQAFGWWARAREILSTLVASRVIEGSKQKARRPQPTRFKLFIQLFERGRQI
ncbi:MAG: hypothetical protein AAFY27_01410 [Pseudomonadota bacterium]